MAIGISGSISISRRNDLRTPFSRCSLDGLARSQHPAHNRRVQLVFPLRDVSGIVLDSKNEDRKRPFFIERFSSDRHRQYAIESTLAVGGFIAMFADIPGEDAGLIEVVGQAVVGL